MMFQYTMSGNPRYPYRLSARCTVLVPELELHVAEWISTEWIWLYAPEDIPTSAHKRFGLRLEITQGYCWDGPSGPTRDTPNSMRASLFHDACYQLLREKLLPLSARGAADRLFRRLLHEDGMSWLRRSIWYGSVRLFARRAAKARVS